MTKMNINKFVFNDFCENTFIIWDEVSREAAIIDPGCNDTNEEEELDRFISVNNLKVKYLFNTHGHIDHVLGNHFVKTKYNPEFWFPKEDLFILEKLDEIGKNYGIKTTTSPLPDKYFEEIVELTLGESVIKPMFTPGHSPGEFCLYVSESSFCITGDVLFCEGIGRTDLWGGDFNTLENSIKSKLFVLPDETTIYPGHGPESTIKHEKENNPFL